MGSIRSLLYFISQQLAVNLTHCWLSFGADTVVPAVGGGNVQLEETACE